MDDKEMIKYKLERTPKCVSCKNSSKFYKETTNSFLGTRFKTEWYTCNSCGKPFAKISKIIGQNNNGFQISKMV